MLKPCLLGLCIVDWVAAEFVCDYQVSVVQFDAGTGLLLQDNLLVDMLSLNVGYGSSGVASIDIANPACIAGSCPVILKGNNLDKLLPDIMGGSMFTDMLCYFGPDLPCSTVPTNLRPDEMMCGSPTLPAEHGVVQFGVLVLGPNGQEPGILYLPVGVEGLEVNFFDSNAPPQLLRVDPPASDVLSVPETFTVYGTNLGPGRVGIVQPLRCQWGDEALQVGTYDETSQVAGDTEVSVECPGPTGTYSPGTYLHVRIALAGFSTSEELFSMLPGAPLVFFDAQRKVILKGYDPKSPVYGDVNGGTTLRLAGDNFAPLGAGLQCVFETPNRKVGNLTVNESAVTATFHSPTLLSCESPAYGLRLGETPVYINTTYNSSLFAGGVDARQTVNFTYYDRTLPPTIFDLHPRHAPIGGRALRFVGGEGVWGQWKGSTPVGGIVLIGHNFAPTEYLWCAFGMDLEQYNTARGPWRWTRAVYLNASAVACSVPTGFIGDYPVAASTDDRKFSTVTSILSYYDPSQTALLTRGQQLAIAASKSGYYKMVAGEVQPDDSKDVLTLAGRNFAPFTTDGMLLCRFGPMEVLREEMWVPANNTDPIALFENIVHASFVNGRRIQCRAPYRLPGTAMPIHVSMGGLTNFSKDVAMLTYYDGSTMIPGAGATQVSSIVPSYGPIRGMSLVIATGTNFAPTGWTADAVGQSSRLACTLRPSHPDGWAGFTPGFLPPALFVDYNRVLCNYSADLFETVGDATAGVTLYKEQVGISLLQAGPPFTFFDPERPPSVTDEQRPGRQPGFVDIAYGIVGIPSNVTLTCENVAPTPGLRCEFHESADIAAFGGSPRYETPATFLSATRVKCILPPGHTSEMMSVHVNRNDAQRSQPSIGPSAARLVYYDPTFPPTVSAVVDEASAAPYLSVNTGGTLIVRGTNFAPTGPAALRCLFSPVEPAAALMELQTTTRSTAALLAPSIGNEEPGSVAVSATYVDAHTVLCALAPDTSPAIGDVRVRVAHTEDGTWSNTSALITLFDASRPAVIYQLSPMYADREAPMILNVTGANLAPTGSNKLRCRFDTAEEEAGSVEATFVSSSFVLCAPPRRGDIGVGQVSQAVQVRLTHSGTSHLGLSEVALPLLYIDTTVPPIISMVTPNYGPIHDPIRVHLTGWNLAPVGHQLRCRFGRAPFTRGGWRGNATVECVSPPTSYQTILTQQLGPYLTDASSDIGTVVARLSIVGGPNATVGNTSWFVYYDPLAPPSIKSIVTPARPFERGAIADENGGEIVRLIGSNIAPTGELGCRFSSVALTKYEETDNLSDGVIVEASFVSPEELLCLSPSLSLLNSRDVLVFATHNATAAANGDGGYAFGDSAGGQWSPHGMPLVYVDPASPPELIDVLPAYGSTSGGTVLTVRGANLAPTANFVCSFSFNSELTLINAAPTLVPASFMNASMATCVSPAVPTPPSGTAITAHDAQITLMLYHGGPASVGLVFTYYVPSMPPEVYKATPLYSDLQAGGQLRLAGANFAPTVAQLQCLFVDESHGVLDGSSRWASSGESISDSGSTLYFRAVVAGSFISSGEILCEVPLCTNFSAAPCDGTLRIRASHRGDAPDAWSNSYTPFTFFRQSEPPSIFKVEPEDIPGIGTYADIRTPSNITIHAYNLAPTRDELLCRFGEGGPLAVASFHHARMARCASPIALNITSHNRDNTTAMHRGVRVGQVHLSVSHSAGDSWSTSSHNVTFYDGERAPQPDSILPFLASPGEPLTVTLFGSNFAPRLPLNCSHAGRTSHAVWISDTMLQCEVPPAPIGSFEPLVVLSHGLEGASTQRLTHYDPAARPLVRAIEPAYGPMHGGTEYVHTIFGANFAPTGKLRCRYGFNAEGDVDALYLTPTTIACARPAFNISADVPVVVSHDGGVSFSGTATRFTFYNQSAPMIISNVLPQFGPAAGGTRLQISGSNFAPHPSLGCAVGGRVGEAIFDSANLIRCVTPSLKYARRSQEANVTIHMGMEPYADSTGSFALAMVMFTYYDPATPAVVSRLLPAYGATGGGQMVSILGSNFAPTSSDPMLCQFGVSAPVPATYQSNEGLRCTTPMHPIGDVYVLVLSADRMMRSSANVASRFTYYEPTMPPAILRLVPQSCDVTAMAQCKLYVTGFNFAPIHGALASGGTGREADGNQDENGTELNADSASGIDGGSSTDTSNGSDAGNSLDAGSGWDSGSGSDAGSGSSDTGVGSVGDSSRGPLCRFSTPGEPPITVFATFVSAELMHCATPDDLKLVPGDYHVHAAHHSLGEWTTGAGARLTLYFGNISATVHSVSPVYVHPLGGTLLTISGQNFAQTDSLQCTFNSTDVALDNTPHNVAIRAATFVSYQQVTCMVPSAIEMGVSDELGAVNVAISQDGGISYSDRRTLRFSKLLIRSIQPIAGPTSGGTLVTISGLAMRDVSRCRFGGERASFDTILHHTVEPVEAHDAFVVCRAPGHTRGKVLLSLSYGHVHWSEPMLYTYYEQPVLTGLRPAAGRSGGGTLLRLLGYGFENFASPNASAAEIATDDSSAESLLSTANTSVLCRFGHGKNALVTPLIGRTATVLRCRTPPYAVGHTSVEVALNGQDFVSALPAAVFTFYPEPLLKTLKPRGGPVNGASTVAIEGSGFMPNVLVERDLLHIVCRFGDRFHPEFQHTVSAHRVTDDEVSCNSPSTMLTGYPDGYPGAVEMSIALNGGADATSDDVDFTIGTAGPDALQFLYYRVSLVAIRPSGAPVHGGTLITLDGTGFGTDSGCDSNSTARQSGSNSSNVRDGERDADLHCNSTASNGTRPRCKFSFGASFAAATVFGTSYSNTLICEAPPAPLPGNAPVLVSLNGVDYNEFPKDSTVLGVYALQYYELPVILGSDGLDTTGTSGNGDDGIIDDSSSDSIESTGSTSTGATQTPRGIEPPGGPVLGGTVVSFFGTGLARFGQDSLTVTPEFVKVVSMGSENGGGYVIDGRVRGELNLTRGIRYTFEVVALGNPLSLTMSNLGGPIAEQLLVTTGPDVNPIEYGELTFVADASLPSSFYFQSTVFQWHTRDPSIQRVNLFDPIGTSKLRFGTDAHSPSAKIRSRNDSVLEAIAPAMANGTKLVGVMFSPNGAEEDYVGPSNFTYYDEPLIKAVIPAGSPIHGGTEVTLSGAGFAQALEALPDDRVRCLFDAADDIRVLPQATPILFRNDTCIICHSPPSWLGRPPYLMHGAPLRLVARSVRIRVALNGVTGSVSSVRFDYYQLPNVSALVPRSGPILGQTVVLLQGSGFAAYTSPYMRQSCRFGAVSVRLHIFNDTAALCSAPPASTAGLVNVQIALNGVDYGQHGIQQQSYEYFELPLIRSFWPLGGVAEGGTIVTIHGSGFQLQHTLPPIQGSVDAPKCLFGNLNDVGWVASVSALGTTILTTSASPEGTVGNVAGKESGVGDDIGFEGSSGDDAAVVESGSGDVVVGMDAGSGSGVTEIDAVGIEPQTWLPTRTNWSYFLSWNDTVATCAVPLLFGGAPGQTQDLRVAVALNGQDFTNGIMNETFVVYDRPRLLSLTPSSGSAVGGTRVRIHGHALDALFLPGISLCHFGSQSTPIDDVAGGSISCRSPAAGVGSEQIQVTLNGQDNHAGDPILSFGFYANPWILSAVPNGGPVAGGTFVTIRGHGLQGGAIEGKLLAPRCKFCHSDAWSYAPSRCARGADADGRPVSGGEYSNSTWLLTVNDTGDAHPSDSSIESIVCVTPAVPKGTVTLELALNAVDGAPSDVQFTFFQQPTISSLSLAGGPSTGGTVVTLLGEGFDVFGAVEHANAWGTTGGASASHRLVSRCRFGQLDVPVIDMTARRAMCITPPVPAVGTFKVYLSLNGEAMNYVPSPTNFTFFSVSLSSVTPHAGPTGGGTQVVVSGSGLDGFHVSSEESAASFSSRALCQFAGTMVNATIDGHSSIRCISPPSMDGKRDATVSVSINGIDFVGNPGGGELNGTLGPGAATLSFLYYEQPRLVRLAPVGGPVEGRTVVLLTTAAPLPLRDLMVLRCRFGNVDVRATAVAKALNAGYGTDLPGSLNAIHTGTMIHTGDDASIACLAPTVDDADDVEVTISLNGQQYAASETALFSSLPSASLHGKEASLSETLPGLRFRFYQPPTVVSIEPRSGPVAGGTAVLVSGSGFLGNILHGGSHTAQCRMGTTAVQATVRSDTKLECHAPRASTGLATLTVTLNHGSDWHGNSTTYAPSVADAQIADVQFRYVCEPSAALERCLQNSGCGWCYDDSAYATSTQCMACLVNPSTGEHTCAQGPALPMMCVSWTYVREFELEGNVGAQSAVLTNQSVEPGRMAYLKAVPPHSHAMLRLLVVSGDALGVYRSFGRAPEAKRELEVPDGWPQELPGPALLRCEMAGEQSIGCTTPSTESVAWYIGLQGRVFFSHTVIHPKRVMAEGVLEPPLNHGTEAHLYPPHDGNYQVRRSRSSSFDALLAWDFEYQRFDQAMCGSQPAFCGLNPVGAAAAGSDMRNATLLRGRRMDAGALWYREPLPMSHGFETRFTFKVSNGSICAAALQPGLPCPDESSIGGSGFSLVIHTAADGVEALGCEGKKNQYTSSCSECIDHALILRFDTHYNLSTDASGRPQWAHYNQVRLLTHGCTDEGAAELLVGHVLGTRVYLDDGAIHAVRLVYTASQLSVWLDEMEVLRTPLVLQNRHSAESTSKHSVVQFLSTNGGELLQTHILDRRGCAFIGFMATSNAFGHEQYEIGSWSFRRKLSISVALPMTESEAKQIAEVERATSFSFATGDPANAESGSGTDSDGVADAGSGSGIGGFSAEVESGSLAIEETVT